jgi:hypothetical protein
MSEFAKTRLRHMQYRPVLIKGFLKGKAKLTVAMKARMRYQEPSIRNIPLAVRTL